MTQSKAQLTPSAGYIQFRLKEEGKLELGNAGKLQRRNRRHHAKPFLVSGGEACPALGHGAGVPGPYDPCLAQLVASRLYPAKEAALAATLILEVS